MIAQYALLKAILNNLKQRDILKIMIITGFFNVFLFGVLGGFLGELLKWYNLRTSKNLPVYIKSPFYWIITMLIILSGGFLAILYGYEDINAISAVNIGLSCPLIIRALASNNNTSENFTDSSRMKRLSMEKYLKKEYKIIDFLSGK